MTQYALDQADITIDLKRQTLSLNRLDKLYVISSGKTALAKLKTAAKNPARLHGVAEKFGQSSPLNAVFIARQPTGEVYSPQTSAAQYPERDWILSRILWLSGLECGFNQGEGRDTYQRYIYIHGTPDTESMGFLMSHGRIRMRNADVAELFELVPENALVYCRVSRLPADAANAPVFLAS